MTQKKNPSFQAGGKYLAKGQYGCVFSPALLCKEHKQRSANKQMYEHSIGKVFKEKDEFGQELNLYKTIVEKLDPSSEFTVRMRNSCLVGAMSKAEQKNACSSIKPDLPQIIMDNGGMDLLEWSKRNHGKAQSFIKLFSKLGPVLRGLLSMIQAGVVHRDIKCTNLLYDGNSVRIVDFGLMTKKELVFSPDSDYILDYDYPYFPVEFKAYLAKTQQQLEPAALKAYLHENLTASEYLGKDPFLWFNAMGVHVDESLLALSHEMKAVLREKSSRDELYASYAETTDLYAFGITLLVLYARMDLIERNTFSNAILIKLAFIRAFIGKLIDLNPRRRLSANDAFNEYMKLHALIFPKK